MLAAVTDVNNIPSSNSCSLRRESDRAPGFAEQAAATVMTNGALTVRSVKIEQRDQIEGVHEPQSR